MNTDSKDDAEDWPLALVESFKDLQELGRYGGTLEEFVTVSYRLFRQRWVAAGSDREPPSYRRWLANIRAVEANRRD